MGYNVLSPTKGKGLEKYGVFDIETYKWVNPYALGFYDGKSYKQFLGKNCISDFLKDVIRHKYRSYKLYAHNGGKFDFNFLAEDLKSTDRKIEFMLRGSTCVQLQVYHFKNIDEEGKLKQRISTKFVDSYTLLPYSLDKLTTDFDVVHKKINFMENQKDKRDYEYLYELYKEKNRRFNEYLRNDVLGLYEVIRKFYDLIGKENGSVGLTLASTSLKTFKSSCLDYKLTMTSKDNNNEMKLGYYGGRTEIFKQYLPDGEYYCFDINSLYPFVMKGNLYPISRPTVILEPNKTMILENLGITKCRVTTPPDIYYPLLPYKYNMKLYFPVGTFEGYWDNSLLQKAYDLGYKIKPIKMFSFNGEKIFDNYISKFYEIKKRAKQNTAPYIIAKLLMNSLYGKFAQSQESDMLIKIDSNTDISQYDIVDMVDADYNLFKVRSEATGTHFIPQISIHVTALAQLRLYDYFEYINNKGGIVAYCDTDSLFTDIQLPVSNKLGDMKKEYGFIRAYFLLPKTYYIVHKKGGKVKAKGFIKEFQKKLDENSFKKALFKKDYSDFKMESEPEFNSMKSSYRRHHTFISVDRRRKSIRSYYDKRNIIKGFNTKPKNIKEIIEP